MHTPALSAAPSQAAPTPATGRAVSARNATTHGLFARDVVLPALGEDPAAFDALLTQLCAQLPPRNLLERHYLEQIAAASWRLRRLHRWQAQLYEDETLAEDQRLDRLDKVLRHETALTRQIDRAVRTLGRDLKSLFEDRARADALYGMDICESECKADLYRELDVQRRAGAQVRSQSADAPLDYATLDARDASITPPAFPAPRDDQNCQNELRQNEDGQNEPLPPPATPAMTCSHWPLSLSEGGGVADEAGVGANEPGRTATERLGHSLTQVSQGKAFDYIAYRKREQAIYNRFHPDRPDTTDWDSPDSQEVYGKR